MSDTPSPPLWMPVGSVRALLALLAWVGTGALLFMGKEVPEQLWTLDGAISALYFALRNGGASLRAR